MKLKITNNLILSLCVLSLIVICFLSVNAPMSFEKKQHEREIAVSKRLMKIRAAEINYRHDNKVYTADFATLVKKGYLADSLQYIPFCDNKKFDITATVQVTKSGRQIPLLECGAGYADYLNGLDENSIANLIQEANESGKYAGIKIGDIASGEEQLTLNK